MSPKCGAESGGKGMQDTRPPVGPLEGDPSFLILGSEVLGVFGGEMGAAKYGEVAGGRFALAFLMGAGSPTGGISTTGMDAVAGFDSVFANLPFVSRCC